MKKFLSVILLLTMLTATLVSCGTGITVEIEYIVNGETYQTNTFSGNTIPSLASDPQSDEPCAVFDGWYFDDNVWKEPLTLQSLQEIQLKEKANIKVYAHFTYEHNFENNVCVNCNEEQETNGDDNTDEELFLYEIVTNFDGSSTVTIKGISNTDATKIEIPETIKQIPVRDIAENAFFALHKLEEVVIPSTVEFVQSGAFVNCENLKKVIFLSNKMKTLYDGTFKGCPALETIAVQNPIIIEEYLSALPALKTIEFNGTVEESKFGIHLSGISSKPGVTVKCTDGERLLSNYEGAVFYQSYSDRPSVQQTIYRYAQTPEQLPEKYIKSTMVADLSVEQIEAAYKAGELGEVNYFVCDAETVKILIEKALICGYDTSEFVSDRWSPDGYWDEFKQDDGLTYAISVPVTKYSFEDGTPTVRGNDDVAYVVCLKASDGNSYLDSHLLYELMTSHFIELTDYYSNY